MKTRSKLAVSLVLGLAMILSVFCAGIALAETPVGAQVGADASSFDSNGWFTQNAYNAMEDKTNVLDTSGNATYLGYVAPEALGGYNAIATWASGKILNNKQLPVADGVSFEIGIQPSGAPGDHGSRFIYFVDSEEIDGYLGLNENSHVLTLFFDEMGEKAQVYVNGQQATLSNNEPEIRLEDNIRTIWEVAANSRFHYVNTEFEADKVNIYIDNNLILSTDQISAASFPSGKVQLVFSGNDGGGAPYVHFSAFNPFTVIKSSVPTNGIKIPAMSENITVDLTKEITGISLINGEESIALEKDIDYTVDGLEVTIFKTVLTEEPTNYFDSNISFVFTSAEEEPRTTSLAVSTRYFDPPVYTQDSVLEVAEDLTEDATFEVTYENDETYTLTANGEAVDASNYTATWAAGKIAVTLKADYLNGLTQGAYTFTLNTLSGSVNYVVYRKTMANSWITLGDGTTSDESEESAVKDEAGSTTLNLGFMGHAYYSEKIDVTKTIYIEMNMNKVVSDPNPHGWFAIGLTNDVTKVGSLNEGNSDDRLTFLYGHAKGEFQCLSIVANAIFKPEFVNQNGPQLFALTFAEANEDGTTKEGSKTTLYFNGELVFETTERNQADFKDGAYLGLFSAIDVLNITTRTNPTSPVANTLGLEYDLGTDADITVPLYNTTAVTAVRYGDTTLTSEQFSFDGSKLTVKGSFLSTVVYDSIMKLVAVCDGGVEVTIPVKVNSEITPETAFVSYMGETGATFAEFEGKTITQIIDTATLAELTEEQYTFANGVLTFAKDYFTEKGTYCFAVVADGTLYYAMVINQTYSADGIANLLDEKKTASVTDGVLTVEGESSYLYKELVDLTSKTEYTLNITNLNGLYNSGLTGSVDAYVALTFYDMFSGNTVSVKFYQNSTTAGVQPTYIEVTLRDRNGSQVYYNSTAIADQTNFFDFNVIGEHKIALTAADGVLTIEIDGQLIYLDLGNTEMTRLQLGVVATADIDGNKNACTFAAAAGSVEPPKDNDNGCQNGCGNSVTGGMALSVAVLALAAAGIILFKAKKA